MTAVPADSRGAHANNFDLLRLLAALQVAVGHSFTWLQVPLPKVIEELFRSMPGVAVFFVISGFLITRSYVERNQGLASYFARRALRIYPALWLQYVFVIVLMSVTGGFALYTLADPRFWKWLGYAAVVGSNFWASALTIYSPFSYDGLYKWYPADVLWTIPVEIGFYLLVPLVFAHWLGRRGWVAPIVAVAFAASASYAYVAGPLLRDHGNLNSTGMIHSSPAPYLWLFLCGGVSAYYWRHLSSFFEGRAGWWLAACAAGAALNWWLAGTIDLSYRIPTALTIPRGVLLAGLVVSCAYSWTGLSRWMRGVDLSYGLYLFHLPFPFGMYYAGVGGKLWYVAVSLLIAFALAAASWVLVEKPALRMKAIFERRRPAADPRVRA